MPVIFQTRIYRSDLKANPGVLYVFGDNLKRVGMGGQAGEMRGEPNAVGVATKVAPGMAEEDFFSDRSNLLKVASVWMIDFVPIKKALEAGKTVVFPLDGLGTGLSELPTRAPILHQTLKALIEKLKETHG